MPGTEAYRFGINEVINRLSLLNTSRAQGYSMLHMTPGKTRLGYFAILKQNDYKAH